MNLVLSVLAALIVGFPVMWLINSHPFFWRHPLLALPVCFVVGMGISIGVQMALR